MSMGNKVQVAIQTFCIIVLGLSAIVTIVYGLHAMPQVYIWGIAVVWGIYLTTVIYGIVKSAAAAKNKKNTHRDWFNI